MALIRISLCNHFGNSVLHSREEGQEEKRERRMLRKIKISFQNLVFGLSIEKT